MKTAANSALIVVDMQNDFCPGGALAVPGGDTIVPLINQLMPQFACVVLSQDWHPADHIGFADRHQAEPFSTVQLDYGIQVLWPTHCVQGSSGAEFHPQLNTDAAQLVIRKGFRRHIDSYSAFQENDQTTVTGLAGYLQARGVEHLYFCGLATDFCVAWSALDARALGFEATLIEDACRAIDLDGSLDAAKERMREAGVQFVHSSQIKTP